MASASTKAATATPRRKTTADTFMAMTVNNGKLPFKVSRHGARSLPDQVADGLRAAIVQGRYRPGDEIPSSREMVPMLGVSRIVTRAALARLSSEGYIHTRPGMRSVVLDRGQRHWRGHVLFVYPWGDDNYDQTIISATLRDILAAEGYLVTTIGVGGSNVTPCDFTILDAALSGSVDLVATIRDCPELFAHLRRRKVPFTTHFGGGAPAGAAGHTSLDAAPALAGLATACAASGARRLVAVSWCKTSFDLGRAFAGTGIRLKEAHLDVDTSGGRLRAVEHAGRIFFERLLADGGISRDTVYFTTDDYLARGALIAFSCAGLLSPRDFRFASLSNVGIGPDYPHALSCIEYDPFSIGRELARCLVGLLKNGAYPGASVVGPVWRDGETIG